MAIASSYTHVKKRRILEQVLAKKKRKEKHLSETLFRDPFSLKERRYQP